MITIITTVSEAKIMQPFMGKAAVLITVEFYVLELLLSAYYSPILSLLALSPASVPPRHPFSLWSFNLMRFSSFGMVSQQLFDYALSSPILVSHFLTAYIQIHTEDLALFFQYIYFSVLPKVLVLHNK